MDRSGAEVAVPADRRAPEALRALHGRTVPGEAVAVRLIGPRAPTWPAGRLADCLEGAGFVDSEVEAAGLVPASRGPEAALDAGLGLTDLVKRATPRAAALSPAEYQAGALRVERLARWMRPGIVAFVGLTGYRAAIDRSAEVGLQPGSVGGRPAYVLPSTSGANAHARLDDLVAHLTTAAAHARVAR